MDGKLTCTKMSGDAWKFTRDPFRDTYEVHCEGSRPVRVRIYQKSQDRVLRTLFDYHISEQEYLGDGRIVLRIGDTPEENLEDIKETVLNKLSGLS